MESIMHKIQNKIIYRSERVKAVDFHSTEPWILLSVYSGNVCIWNFQTQAIEKSFKVTDSPVRSAKFIPNKDWIVTGADDSYIRVYNYNTMEKTREFKSHEDYIRCLEIHPTLPYMLSASDDKVIKLWDWEKNWLCVQEFKGHSHYVMRVSFNPSDTQEFASASLDGTLKIWNVDSPNEKFTLEGHLNGVNCIEYIASKEKLHLLSGSDDNMIKVWNQEDKSCIHTLEGHAHNVTALCAHPDLPIIISGSEDGTIRIWKADTYKLEDTLNFGLGRVWGIGFMKNTNQLGFACDEGTVVANIIGSDVQES